MVADIGGGDHAGGGRRHGIDLLAEMHREAVDARAQDQLPLVAELHRIGDIAAQRVGVGFDVHPLIGERRRERLMFVQGEQALHQARVGKVAGSELSTSYSPPTWILCWISPVANFTSALTWVCNSSWVPVTVKSLGVMVAAVSGVARVTVRGQGRLAGCLAIRIDSVAALGAHSQPIREVMFQLDRADIGGRLEAVAGIAIVVLARQECRRAAEIPGLAENPECRFRTGRNS